MYKSLQIVSIEWHKVVIDPTLILSRCYVKFIKETTHVLDYNPLIIQTQDICKPKDNPHLHQAQLNQAGFYISN